ncbi:hypothetical protein M8C21_008235 [Ambrosia artemisiifolia]|uniref:Uncharacterized protein n=1 Tax=Ambrosia artemisiifolia TaxID=4212 RepID=A0AAD5CS59_AMBAR|nr:hypothetical protein M8C21_008235 [Ambrosia artemisiifolia]
MIEFPVRYCLSIPYTPNLPLSLYIERNTPLMEILRVEEMEHGLVPVLFCILLSSTVLANSAEASASSTFRVSQASLSRKILSLPPHPYGHNTPPRIPKPPPPPPHMRSPPPHKRYMPPRECPPPPSTHVPTPCKPHPPTA